MLSAFTKFPKEVLRPLVSALGHKPTWRPLSAMSALPAKADLDKVKLHVRFWTHSGRPTMVVRAVSCYDV